MCKLKKLSNDKVASPGAKGKGEDSEEEEEAKDKEVSEGGQGQGARGPGVWGGGWNRRWIRMGGEVGYGQGARRQGGR